jgi:proline racemase
MSEAEVDPAADAARVHTGVEAVDAVIASVDALAAAPVDEHAAVFGSAHDALRRALDTDPEA